MITLHSATIRLYHNPLKTPFRVSFGTITAIPSIIIELTDNEGRVGLGEASILPQPLYTHESEHTAMVALEHILLPALLKKTTFSKVTEAEEVFTPIRRHYIARSACIMALYDLFAQEANTPLAHFIGGENGIKSRSETISIYDDPKETLHAAKELHSRGIDSLKVKIAPGKDFKQLESIRKNFPESELMVDANASYTYSDLKSIQALEELDIFMMEQPLHNEDLVQHSKLRKNTSIPIALDESIESLYSLETSIELESMDALNLKLARVGGYTNALQMVEKCTQENIKLWVGGMMETPIGMAHNLTLHSRKECTLPIDFLAPTILLEEFAEMSNTPLPMKITGSDVKLEFTEPGLGVSLNKEFMSKRKVHEVSL